MTIPRLPGPLDWLTNTAQAGFQAYDTERARKYEEALTGSRLIAGLIQAGQLDPNILADPNVQSQFAAARIPVPPAGSIVPSSRAARERRTVNRVQGMEPGSTEESLTLDLPLVGQIREADLLADAAQLKKEIFDKYPAVARKLAGVFAPEATTNQELAASASAAPQEYTFAAENFIAQAQGDAKTAKSLAAADPQYAELVANGQLSDEYFARAAAAWKRLDDETKLKWAEIAARRLAAEREARLYYEGQLRSYNTEVGQLQKQIEENQLTDLEKLFLPSIQRKVQAGQPLSQDEQLTLQKIQTAQTAQQQIQQLSGERADVRDRFIQRANPIDPNAQIVPPQANAPAARRGQSQLDPRLQGAVEMLKSGRGTAAQLRASKSFTEEEKRRILQAAGAKP